MNLEDVIDPEYGLQQDEWSLSKPTFGKLGQLTVVGHSGKQGKTKLYVVKCDICSEDSELFGEGYFKSRKNNLIRGGMPCGCARNPRWSKEQYYILCSRRAKETKYVFIGFSGDWNGVFTNVIRVCAEHGEWSTSTINRLIEGDTACPVCSAKLIGEKIRKSDEDMVKSFLSTGAFHPETKFWRSDRLNKEGAKVHWFVHCPVCDQVKERQTGGLHRGNCPCSCSTHRQQEGYINWLIDGDNIVAIKFGIANDSNHRRKKQCQTCVYEVKEHSVYIFPSVDLCKKAEQECKKELECGVVLKRDMKDGYTETTYAYNLDKIVEIYERNGGIRVD